jgi:DNA-binding winged helix-turn-helix (wHTH) protein
VSGIIYAFGSFELDSVKRRLLRHGEAVGISDRHFEVLLRLLAEPGSVISKDALIEAAWPDVAVTDNSLEQAISTLRRMLGEPWIETVPRRGYRFTADVTRRVARESDESIETRLAPHRAWLEGRAALESLGRTQAAQARETFAGVLALAPDYAAAHIGMANACAFEFEATRADETPDRTALAAALAHARDACRLEPESAEPWATMGFVLHLMRQPQHAIAATQRAIVLEPDNWRHHLRLSVVGWGEERLRAAQRALALLPGLALAHWLAATVHVARHSLDRAVRELELGAAAQDAQEDSARFNAVALHWLLGMVSLAQGDEARARAEFTRELAFEGSGHLYARECCANTWYALGALDLRHRRREEAAAAFSQAVARVPGHVLAMAGLQALGRCDARQFEWRVSALEAMGVVAEPALARAVRLSIDHRTADAANLMAAALQRAPPGSAGWTIPIDPLLGVSTDPTPWRTVLAALRARAA